MTQRLHWKNEAWMEYLLKNRDITKPLAQEWQRLAKEYERTN